MERKNIVLSCFLLILLLLTGCEISLKDEKCDAFLEKAVVAIEEADADAFIDLFWKEILEETSRENMQIVFGDMTVIWKGNLKNYKIQSKSISVGEDSNKYIKCVYNVETTESKYIITIQRVEDSEGLNEMTWFNIQRN